MSEAPLIQAEGVHLEYPVYSVSAQSIRKSVINAAVGGKLMKSAQGVVQVAALKHVSFRLHEGDRLGIVGHNGSGKTTLLKVLAGIYPPTQGWVKVRGEISSMLDISVGMDGQATGADNIKLLGRMRGLSGREIEAKLPEIVELSELGAYIHLPMRTYSAGMAARLAFMFATSFDPDIMVLDEWLGAGDASFAEKAKARMDHVVGRSRCVILATHALGMVETFCNKLLVLNNGRIAYFGDTEEFFSAPRATLGEHSLGGGIPVEKMASGWFAGEGWGRWASQNRAVLNFKRDMNLPIAGLRLKLRAPVHPGGGALTGSVRSNISSKVVPLSVEYPRSMADILIEHDAQVDDDVISIEVVSDRLIRPGDIDPKLGDPREIGFGASSVEFVHQEDLERTRAATAATQRA
jgi:lipopolysaccharide transport system ATP-binding protein